jgi:hypothetical protein
VYTFFGTTLYVMPCTCQLAPHGNGYLKLLFLCRPVESLRLTCSERLTQQHSFTSQKTSILNHTSLKNPKSFTSKCIWRSDTITSLLTYALLAATSHTPHYQHLKVSTGSHRFLYILCSWKSVQKSKCRRVKQQTCMLHGRINSQCLPTKVPILCVRIMTI